jgi:hypothetical protein
MEDARHKSIEWNAENFAGRVYFYRVKAGSVAEVKKLMLVE